MTQIASRVAAVVALTLFASGLLETEISVRRPLFVGAFGIGMFGALAAVRTASTRHPLTAVSWSLDIGGVGLLTVLVVASDSWPLLVGFALFVASATFAYGLRGRSAINTATVAAAAGSTWSLGRDPAQVLLVAGLLVALWILCESRLQDMEAVEEARQREVERATRRADTALATAAIRTLDLQEVHDAIATALGTIGFDQGWVVALDPTDGHVVRAATAQSIVYPAVPAEQGVAGRAATERRTIVVQDYQSSPFVLPGRERVGSVIAVPVMTAKAVTAVLCASYDEPNTIDAQDIEVVEVLALHARHALENVALYRGRGELVRRLREIDELRNDLISNVSHELRTPLQAILGMGETLVAHGDQLPADRSRLLLERINANALRLRDRIDTLLQHARFESGQLVPEPEVVELRTFLESELERLAQTVDDISVVVSGDQEAVVLADPGLLEHVLENLVVNAVNHGRGADLARVTLECIDGEAVVLVHDRGPGLSPDELERVTQRFYRGGAPTRRDDSGLGLGLSLVSSILQAHGSRLRIANRPDGGASFGFALPLAGEVTQDAEHDLPREDVSLDIATAGHD